MDKKIKDYISEKKLSDEDIFKLLTAETLPAKQEEEDKTEEDSEVEEDSTTEDLAEEESAEETPDMRAMIKEILAEELKAMKNGRKAPKVKSTKKVKAPVEQLNRIFGAL